MGGDIHTHPFRRHWFFVVRDVRDADPLVEQRNGAVADAEEEKLQRGRGTVNQDAFLNDRRAGRQVRRKEGREGGRQGEKKGKARKQRTLARYSLGISVMLKAAAIHGTYRRQKTKQGNREGK